MSIFTKIFGSKTVDTSSAVPQVAEFVAVLLMHLRGELEPALRGYQEIAAALPGDAPAPFFAAAILAGKGELAEAAESLRSLSRQLSLVGETLPRAITGKLYALVKDQPTLFRLPAVAEICASFGDLLKQEGFLQESAVCFEVAAGLVPDNAQVLHKLGDTLHDLRIYDYAEEVLLAALKNAPNHWGALYTYAVLLQDLGRNDEAITYYEKAARFNPEHVNCQNNYGAALLRTNRLEEALEHCSRAAALDPASPFVKVNLGNIYLLMQEYEKARTCFAEAISLNASLAVAYFGLGSVEQAMKSSPDQVRELYLKALEINPALAEAHHALGNLLAESGSPEALSHFSLAVQLNNGMKNLQKDFGKACLQLGRREEALEHLETALEQDPNDAVAREILDLVQAEKQA